jgi:hypothetical protein
MNKKKKKTVTWLLYAPHVLGAKKDGKNYVPLTTKGK